MYRIINIMGLDHKLNELIFSKSDVFSVEGPIGKVTPDQFFVPSNMTDTSSYILRSTSQKSIKMDRQHQLINVINLKATNNSHDEDDIVEIREEEDDDDQIQFPFQMSPLSTQLKSFSLDESLEDKQSGISQNNQASLSTLPPPGPSTRRGLIKKISHILSPVIPSPRRFANNNNNNNEGSKSWEPSQSAFFDSEDDEDKSTAFAPPSPQRTSVHMKKRLSKKSSSSSISWPSPRLFSRKQSNPVLPTLLEAMRMVEVAIIDRESRAKLLEEFPSNSDLLLKLQFFVAVQEYEIASDEEIRYQRGATIIKKYIIRDSIFHLENIAPM